MARDSVPEVANGNREQAGCLRPAVAAGEQGAGGEATAAALEALPSREWKTFHDVAWPGRSHAYIDHVLVGPTGVFVIDSLHRSGEVDGAGAVRQAGRSREQVLSAAADAGLAVAALLPEVDGSDVHPVLCLEREGEVTGWVRDVLVCSTANLAELIRSLPVVLGPIDVRTISLGLGAQFRCALATRPKPAPHGPGVDAVDQLQSTKLAKVKKQARAFFMGAAGVGAVVAMTAANPPIHSSAANFLTQLVSSSH